MKYSAQLKQRMQTILSIVAIFYVNATSAQVNPPVVLPPSPESSALIAYNAPEIGLFTGTAQISIPIFQIKNNNFSMPIGLKYSTNGIRVDEIATRTGMNWVLNAGGVITRNINGLPDERAERVYPPSEILLNQDLLSYLNNMASATNKDAEPDEYSFNFNGYSGKFIIDDNGVPVMMPHSNLKVIFSGGTNPEIAILTPDGVRYEFKDVEKSYIGSYCYNGANPFLTSSPTSWYLTQIIQTNGDLIKFIYDDTSYEYRTGISQSITRSDNTSNLGSGTCETGTCLANQNTYCTNSVWLFGKRLKQITYGNVKVDLGYQDRLDIVNDKLLNKIEIKESDSLINKFTFEYAYSAANDIYYNVYNITDPSTKYRPFLTAFKEHGKSQTPKAHLFSYNDIQSLPHRLSFAQDGFGYFNGKINSSFVPNVDDDPYVHALFLNEATANRSIDDSYTDKGVLTKVLYPTGGSDSLVYENNSYSRSKKVPIPTAVTGISGTAQVSLPLTKTSSNFKIEYDHPELIRFFAGMLISTDTEGNSGVNPDVDLMEVSIIRSSDENLMFNQSIKLGQQIDLNLTTLALNTNYYLRINILYTGVKGICNITYPVGNESYERINELSAGLRIGKLLSNNGNGQTMTKKFYYAYKDSLTVSSGVQLMAPVYLDRVSNIISPCTLAGSYFICKNFVMTSNSQRAIYNLGQNSLEYAAVTESFGGNNFENGGIEHVFTLARDSYSRGLVGIDLKLGVKRSNSGYLNGYENTTNYFKNTGAIIEKIKTVKNFYSLHADINKVYPAYVINKYFELPTHSSPPLPQEFDGYEMYKYNFHSRWPVLDSIITLDFINPSNSIKTKQTYVYNNSGHLQPTQLNTYSSIGKDISIIKSYPAEMVSMGKDPANVYSSMVNANVVTPVIEETKKYDGQQTSVQTTEYAQPYSGQFLPYKVKLWNKDTGLQETMLVNSAYGSKGKLLEYMQADGIKVSYLWSYDGQYPVFEVKNADYLSVEALLGGFSAVESLYNSSPDKATLDSKLAILKSGLPNAQVTGYTYRPLVGMTSMTDAKGMTTYYEYDSFQRLKLARDQNGNIVKQYRYNYKQ